MPSEWNIHYARWVIDDGEPERSVEEDFEWFSVAFYSKEKLTIVPKSSRAATPSSDYKYLVVAEIVFLSEKACVIDFGLRAIGPADLVPHRCKEGDYITGEVVLNFPLCTELAPDEVLATLKHGWHVNRIEADITPFKRHWSARKTYVRDDAHIRYEPVASTSSVRTHTYVLNCTLLD